ncbi:outer membrane beta-barrel protein [Pedobacter frigoris]|uniref:outer membrane beta-barrel protein n=1 Tax=Pedobacter frigoris TaxID=2571272 RepID=UPI00292D305E|nr:outer membrane beta-barrel protein [Pedobacter frigoris]
MKFLTLCTLSCVFTLYSLDGNAQDKPVQLNNVTISVPKKALKETARGSSLDLTKIPDAKFWTLADALKQIPGVEIDEVTNKITYMGKEVSILRDGVSVAGFDNQVLNTLNSGSAITYDKIELNLFDLKTERPTLSFVAPTYQEGYFGSVGGTLGTNSSTLNSSLSLSKKKHLLNIIPSASLMYAPKNDVNWETDYYNRNYKELRKNEQQKNYSNSASLGINDSYFIAAGHTLNTSFNYSANEMTYNMLTTNEQYRAGALSSRTKILLENSAEAGPNNIAKANVGYIYKPRTGEYSSKRFDVSLEYELKNSSNEANAYATALSGGFIPHSNYKSINGGKDKGIYGLVGYEYKHQKSGNFEFVMKYFNRSQYKTYDYNYQVNEAGADSTIFQDNDITYNYGAFLVSWDRAFRDFSMRLVLKEDYSNDFIKNYKGRDKVSFITFSPYLSVLRNIKTGSLRFEAQYSQRRPELSMMSTVINYGGQFSISGMQTIGNPDLKPARILDLSGTVNTAVGDLGIIATGRFAHTANAISQYRMAVDSTIIQTYRNLSSSDQYKGDISFNFFLLPRLTAQLSSNLSFVNFHLDASTVQKTLQWAEGLNFAYTPSPSFRLRSGLSYNGGTSFQSKIPARFGSNFSATYTRGKMNFSCMISNFHQPYFTNESIIEADGYNMHSYNRSRRLIGSINISYRFGKISRSKDNAKDILKDDM